MSRAFVKESDGEELLATRARRQTSDRPNYITPVGEVALREKLARLRSERAAIGADDAEVGARAARAQLDDDIAFLADRLERAIVVVPPAPPWLKVNVGATVELVDAQGEVHVITVVGEDEIDAACGRVSWCSPLGGAVMLRELGDEVIWQRPVGDLTLEIVDIRYADDAD